MATDSYRYHEEGQGRYFNAWTLVHFSTGVWAWTVLRSQLGGLLIHTIYEAIEGDYFPSDHRDRSIKNHVGDTLAFLAGSSLAQVLGVGEEAS
jgi:hypothetical protein